MKLIPFISLLFYMVFFPSNHQVSNQTSSHTEKSKYKTFYSPKDVINFLNSFQNEKKYHIKDIGIKSIQNNNGITPFLVSFKKSGRNPYNHGVWEHLKFFSKKDVEKFINKQGIYNFMEFDFTQLVYAKNKKEYHIFYLRTDIHEYTLTKVKYSEVDEEEIKNNPFITLIKKITIINSPNLYQSKEKSKQKYTARNNFISKPIVSKGDSIDYFLKNSVLVLRHDKYANFLDYCKEYPKSQECILICQGTGGGGSSSPIIPNPTLKYIIDKDVKETGFIDATNSTISLRIEKLSYITLSTFGGKKNPISLELTTKSQFGN